MAATPGQMNRQRILILTLLLFGTTNLFGQNNNFSNSKDISDKTGKPTTVSSLYFPPNLFTDSLHFHNLGKVDCSKVEWYSDLLSATKEPILTNYDIGKEIIRFTWLRTFDEKIIIRIEKTGDNIILYRKKLKHLDNNQFKTSDSSWTYPKRLYNESKFDYAKNDSRQIDLKAWDNLTNMIKEYQLCDMGTYKFSTGVDGAMWLIEFHNKEGWCLAERFTPTIEGDKKFRDIGELILKLAGLKKEEIY